MELTIKGKEFEVRQPVMKQVIEARKIFEKYDFDLYEWASDVDEFDEDNMEENESFREYGEKIMMSGMGPAIAQIALVEKGEDVKQSLQQNSKFIQEYFLFEWSGGSELTEVIADFLLKMFQYLSKTGEETPTPQKKPEPPESEDSNPNKTNFSRNEMTDTPQRNSKN